ncbi:MAG: choice-of-anchor A family protein, partial [Lachnospiraceae bacterium]|nr:choice-of-anchor A family protein [Lachnospiraceae bacterium]
MKRRKLFKSIVAMIALVAMLVENTCSVMASVTGDMLITAEESVLTEEPQSSEIPETDVPDPQTTLTEDTGSSQDDVLAADEPSKEVDINIGEELSEDTSAQNDDGSVTAYNDRIEIKGENETTLYINTDQMNGKDSFELSISGSSSIDYESVLGKTLYKKNSGIYYITGLQGEQAVFKAGSLSEGMSVEYRKRSDGYPQITLISKDAPAAEKSLKVTSDGKEISGSGYEDINITLDGQALPKNAYYGIHIKTDADVLCNGRAVQGGVVPSLSGTSTGIRLSGLNNEAFTLYIKGENVEDITAEYSVDSIANGAVGIVVKKGEGDDETLSENSISENGIDAEKRIYKYEDSKVAITVTLKDPTDLPDEAVLKAVELTEENAPEKLQEVYDSIYAENKDSSLLIENIYVYDITFTLDGEEIEPANPVDVNIVYKAKAEVAPEATVEDVKTFHFNEDEKGNIKSMEEVTDDVVTNKDGEVQEVTVSLESFSTVATAQYISNRTFLGDGGSYSLGYILNSYNMFVEGDVDDRNHTIGPIAAGGNAHIQWWGHHDAMYNGNSYIKGNFEAGDWFDTTGGDYFFLGKDNTRHGVYYQAGTQANGYYTYGINGGQHGINYVKGVYYTDDYIDFNAAFNSIKQEVNGIQSDYTIDKNKKSGDPYYIDNGTLNISSGSTYTLSSLSGISKINIYGADIESAIDTVLIVTSPEDIDGFPEVTFNGNRVESIEFGKYSSVVFVFPNTKNITLKYWAHFGHIVAPNAYVDFATGGNFNGCVIAKKFHSDRFEGHMWPYNGKKFEGSSAGFRAKKTVDGATPASDQVFEFRLEEYKNGAFETLQTVKNNGSLVAFDSIPFGQSDAGMHYFRITESTGNGKFVYDNTQYIVAVKVENVNTGYTISQKTTETYYKVSGSSNNPSDVCVDRNKVSEAVFNNQVIIERGSITLLKKVVPSDSAVKTFYVTVQNGDGEYYNESKGYFDKDYSEVVLAAGTAKKIDGLEYDDYTVTEVKSKATDDFGREYEVTYSDGSVTKTCKPGAADQSFTIGVDGDKSVTVTNKMAGQLKVTKSYVDEAGKAVDDGTVFYVTLSSTTGTGSSKTTYYNVNGSESSTKKAVAIKGGETITFAPLPAGRTYTVTETDASGNAISSGTEYDVVGGTQTFKLSDSSVASLSKDVTITNVKHSNGKINILKKDYTNKAVLDGAEFVLKDTDSGNVIYVTGDAGAYTYSTAASGTSRLTTSKGALCVDGLPYGNYTIEEVTCPYGYTGGNIVMKFTVGSKGVVNNSVSNSLITASMKSGSYEGTYTVLNKRIPFRVRIVKKYSELIGGGEKPLSGVTFTLSKKDSTQTLTGITDSNGIVEFTDLDWGTYTYTETVPSGYVGTSSSTGTFTIDNTTSRSVIDLTGDPVYVINVSNIPVSGGVKLVKSDKNTGKAMAGVTFHLYDVNEKEVYAVLKNGVYTYAAGGTDGATNDYVTDKNGTINVTGLPYGSGYYFTEETPAGYVVNNGKYTFDVSSNGATAEVTVKNDKIRGYVELLKVDQADSSAIEGAVFELYKNDGSKVGSYTTDSKGMITSDMIGSLEFGSYYFVEISAPEGYSFDASKKYSFSISENTSKALRVTAENTRKKGEVSLIKYDENTGIALEGATFGLYSADDLTKAIKTGITDKDGKLSFTGLEWGDYVIREISAPKGYDLDTGSYPFTVDKGHLLIDLTEKYTIYNKQTPGAIRLIKNDGEGHTLEGAVFELYKDGERYPDDKTTFTCDENGEINVSGLPWGTYYFIEISAPEGFVLPSGDAAKTSSVTINADNTVKALTDEERADGQTVHVNVIAVGNERIYGSLLLHKVDSDGKSLAGASFKLMSVDADGKEVQITTSGKGGSYKYDKSGTAQTLDTDKDGVLSVTGLPYGSYRVYEVKAPEGYNLVNIPREFVITRQGQVAEYDFENSLIKANIRFIKVDDKDEPLQGVSFTLFKLIDGEYKSQTTVSSDDKGIVSVEGLGAGTYYFKENALTGYNADTEKMYGFTITEANNGQTLTLPGIEKKVNGLSAIVNTPLKGSAIIKKVAAGDESPLAGAVFALYDAKSNKVVKGYEELVTGSDGYAQADGLEWGSYYFMEVEAPSGYALDRETRYEFTIDAQNVSKTVNAGTAVDTLILGGGKLVKKDAENKEALAGAEFELYGPDGRVVKNYESIKSDENGLVTTKADLNVGTYYFVETRAPEGYELDKDTKYYFTVDQSNMGQIVEANAEGRKDNTAYDNRLKGKAELFKYTENGTDIIGLEGAQFELKIKGSRLLGLIESETTIGTYTTDEKGMIVVKDLEWGEYSFVEIKAPTGYDRNETPIDFTIDAKHLDYSGSTKLSLNNTPGKGSIQLIKKDENTGNTLAGAAFKLWQEADGVTKQIINTGSPDGLFTTNSEGQITVTGLDWGTYYFEEITAPAGYILPADRMSGKAILNKDNIEASVKTPEVITMLNGKALGSMQLIKQNEDGTVVLKDAVFEIYSDANYKNKVYAEDKGNAAYYFSDSKTGTVSEFVTGNEGSFTLDGIPVGTYYIKEVKAPEGYIITVENAGRFTIDEQNTEDNRQNVNLKIVYVKDQRIKGYVELNKYDSEDSEVKLNGVGFDLFKVTGGNEDEKIGHFETVDGKIAKDTIGALEYGDYYFTETATAEGYTFSSEPISFSIREQDKVITLKAVNDRLKGKVVFEKYNSDRTKKLDGAEYELWLTNPEDTVGRIAGLFGKDDRKVGTYTTSGGGLISVEDLAWGTYYFVETKAPVGYVLDKETKYYFTIDADNLEADLTGAKGATDKEEHGAIRLVKDDGEGHTLAGAGFILFKDGERYPDEDTVYTTDNTGSILISDLPYGTYYFEEISVPDGFVLPAGDAAKTKPVTINETNSASSVDVNVIPVSNEKIYGSLKLRKVDADKNELSGAEFYIVKFEDGTEKNIALKGSDGSYSFDKETETVKERQTLTTNGAYLSVTDLPFGTYRVYESKAPKGYNRIETPFEFNVDIQGKEITHDFENSLIQAGVEFLKTDENGKVLEGAVFTLYKKNGTGEPVNLGTVTSNVNGRVFKNGLGAGEYYFEETVPPTGYIKSDKQYSFAITAEDNNKVVTLNLAEADGEQDGLAVVVNTARKGSIAIEKKDETNKEALDGAEFYLKDDDTDALIYVKGSAGSYTYTTDTQGVSILTTQGGRLAVSELPYGNYRIEEITYPYGYLDSDIEMKFSIGTEGVVNRSVSNKLIVASMQRGEYEGTYTVYNKRIPFRVRILKKYDPLLSDKQKALEGVTFTLKKDGSEQIWTAVTGKDGVAEFDALEWGTYTYTETVPTGYVGTESSTGSFTVDSNTDKSLIDFTGTPVFVVNVDNTPVSGGVKLVKSDRNTQEVMSGVGFRLYNAGGNPVYAVLTNGVYAYASSDTEGAVSEYTTDSKGEIHVSGLPYGSDYYFVEITPAGYIVNNNKYSFDVKDNGAEAEVTVKNDKIRGYVELLKKDKTNGSALAGAEFKLYKADGTEIGSYTTDDNGVITADKIGALEYGSYYFAEVSAPDGYIFDKEAKYEFEIKNNTSDPIKIEVENEREKGRVSLIKYDKDTGIALKGATFGLFRATDLENPVATGVTDKNGRLAFTGLNWIDYVIRELEAPKGYDLDETEYGFTVDGSHLVIDLTEKYTIYNKQTPGAIRLVKNDGEGHTLEGAVFELYKDGERYPDSDITYTCDENGAIFVDDLPWGEYYFIETVAPEGFVLPEGDAARTSSVIINADTTKAALTAEEKANGETVHVNLIVVGNEKIYGELELHKVDSDRKSLAGATFRLYSVTTEAGKDTETEVTTTGQAGVYEYALSGTAMELETDADGVLSVKGLPYGNYLIREEKAPEGYNRDENPKFFKIQKQAYKEVMEFENSLVKANVKFVKVDNNDKPLEGVAFLLSKQIDGVRMNQTLAVSDSKGIVEFKGLGTGTYYIEEQPLTGYAENKELYGFTITAENNGQTLTLPGIEKKIDGYSAIVNTPLKGTAVIKKVVKGETTPLAGAVFALYDAKSNKAVEGYGALITGEDGYAKAEELEWGSYYFKEVKAPEGYALDTETKYGFEINAQNVTATVDAGTAEDEIILGGGKLVKKDAESKEVLAGAEFALYTGDGEAVKNYERIVSDAEGLVTTKGDLNIGTYYFVETKAPEGYDADDSRYYFTIDQSNMGTIVEANAESRKDNTAYNYRKPGQAELLKYAVGDAGREGLAGAQFELHKKGKILGIFNKDDVVGIYTTDENGIIRAEQLEWGDYFFTETVAPEGYDKVDTPVEFTIDAEHLDFTGSLKFEMPNGPSRGSIQLIKVDEQTGNRLVGAFFKLWRDNDGVKTQIVNAETPDGLYETDSNGQITVKDLEWGTYYFEETAAPAGYVLPENRFTESKTIDRENVAASVNTPLIITMLNSREYGSVELIKTNEDGTVVLEGAVFEIYSDAAYTDRVFATDGGNGNYVYSSDKKGAVSEYVTNGEGSLRVDGIPVGTYYVKEVKAPEGYLITVENAGMFTIDERNTPDNRQTVNVKTICIKDKRIKGFVELVKIDKNDDENKLNDVEFELYRVINKDSASASTEKVGSYKTVNGMISKDRIGELEYGDYYFKETVAIPGYELNEEQYEFSISEQDKLIEITAENVRKLGKVKFEKYNSDRSRKLDGAVFELYSSNPSGIIQRISEIFGNNEHKVGEYTTKDGGQIFVDNLEWGNYFFKEIKAPAGYVLDENAVYRFTIGADSLEADLTGDRGAVNKEEPGAIRLIKDDGEGHTLAGADFVLYKDGELYPDADTVYTTGDKGEITVENLPFGTYYFREISAPKGFVLPEGDAANSNTVVIDETNTRSAVEVNIIPVSNEKIYGNLSIVKMDGNNNELTGAEFKLVKYEDNSEMNVKVTGEAGHYTYDRTAGFLSVPQTLETDGARLSVTGLPYGTYRLYETKAPEGFKKVDSPYEFSIDAQGKEISHEFDNTLIQANVEFVKADADGRPLEGAVFSLIRVKDGNETDLGTVTSGSDGKIVKKGLGAGDYYFIEKEAPEGYEPSDNRYSFKITPADNGKTVTLDNADINKNGNAMVINTPKKGSVRLKKVIKGTNDGLEGAVFDLYKKGDSAAIRKDLVSDENGYVRAGELEWGTYYFKETKAPDGYVLDEDSTYSFEINAKNVSKEITVDLNGDELRVENAQILGQAKLVKQDSVTGEPVQGAVFTLYSAKDDKAVEGYEEITSDAKGVIITGKDLKAGNYYFKEKTPAPGYEINEDKYSFTISQDNMDKVVSAGQNGKALNTPLKGRVEIFKYTDSADGLTQTGLAGAEFTLYREESLLGINYFKEGQVYTTGADGTITVTDLLWGNYKFVETKAPAGYVIDRTELTFTISATQLDYTGEYRLSLKNEADKGKIGLIKYYAIDGENKGTLEGASFKLWRIDGTEAVQIANNTADGLYVTNKEGRITVTDLEWGSYCFEEISAPDGYAMPDNRRSDTITLNAQNVEESIKSPLTVPMTNDKIYGNVELIKVDDATPANPLAGAVFSLFTENGDKVYVTGKDGVYSYSEKTADTAMTTPENGKITVMQLPYGSYYFVETDAPEGYLVNNEHINFTIEVNQAADAEARVSKTCINASVRAAVSFLKADTDKDTPLEGAVFTLYKAGAGENGSDLEISDVKSDEYGRVTYGNLGVGSYYFREKSTPEDAYKLSTVRYTFTVTGEDNGKTLSLDNVPVNVVINYPKYGSVRLQKFYSVNGSREGTLEGAVFALYRIDEEGNEEFIKDYVSGSAGIIGVRNLEWGSYYFIEKSAPAGYVFDENRKYSFRIDQENVTQVQLVEADNPRQTGSVELEKIDSVDNKPLDGVVFELYKDWGKSTQSLVGTLTTENGRAERQGLLWGDYTLIEKSPITGYVLNETPYRFTIDGDNLTASFTGVDAIKNDRVRGYVELLKKNSETKAPMSDVVFELYKGTESNSKYVASYITNANGKLADETGSEKIGPLDFGEYYFKEVTPTGYVPNEDVITFKIDTNGQTVSFTDNKTVFNTPENGAVILRKTDENGAPLAGAQFTLYATTPKTIGQTLSSLFSDSYEYGTYTTNENGEIRVNGLDWDNYFFIETKAPKGYEIIEPGKKYEFTIDAQSTKTAIELGTIVNKRQTGTLELTKLDDETHRALEGAQFKLFRTENGVDTDVSAQYGASSGVFSTASSGKITISNVEWGSYYFLETAVPEGYEALPEDTQVRSATLTIDANNADAKTNVMQPQSTSMYNRKGYGYVSLKKVFEGTQPASPAGVEFVLINDTKSEKVGTYKTNDEGIITADVIGRLTYGDYHFEETHVPSGISYAVSKFRLAFTIDKSNTMEEPIEFTFVNSEITASAKFVKVDADSGNAIAGIKFNVYRKGNDEIPVTSVTGDASGVVMAEHLTMGDYYFLEDSASAALAGYVADGTRYEFSITENDRPVKDEDGRITEKTVPVYAEGTKTEITTVPNTKGKGSISLIKLGRQLSGSQVQLDVSDAMFELYKDGELYMAADKVAEYVNGQSLVINDLPWGTYYFKELKAPAGYALPAVDAARTNSVTLDGTTVNGSITTPLVCQMSDDSIRVYISKREIGGSDELAGATLQVYEVDEKGNRSEKPVFEWVSGTTPKLIETTVTGTSDSGNGENNDKENGTKGFEAGKTYLLHEDTSPIGYNLTTDITFTVNEDGTVTTNARTSGSTNGMTIIMEDAAINVSISKKEMGSDAELSGARLRILDGEEIIESWVSTGKPHTIAAVLEVGRSYTLEEAEPPKGYYTAEPITFMVKGNGTIQITQDASASAEAGVKESASGNEATLTMYDRPIRVEISKKRLSGGADDYVAGAELALYEQAGSDYTQIFSWISPADGAVLINYGLLQVGKRYKVVETKAPAGYVKADDLYFTVKDYSEFEKTDANGMVTQSVDMFDASVKAVISKQVITGGDELPGATLQIIDETGRVVLEFVSGEKQTLITPVSEESMLSPEEKAAYAKYNVIYGTRLEAGKSYILREITAPYGYAMAEDISFKVDEQGNTIPAPIVMKDKPLEIMLSKKDISDGSYLSGASLELYNEAKEKVAEWISSDKPVLFSTRKIDAAEAARYAEVKAVRLPEGRYILHEAAAPEGYALAEDVVINIDDTCVVSDNGEVREETMYDYKEGKTVILGTKEWIEPRDTYGNIAPDYSYPDITIELYR